jgi:hypothetical protein
MTENLVEVVSVSETPAVTRRAVMGGLGVVGVVGAIDVVARPEWVHAAARSAALAGAGSAARSLVDATVLPDAFRSRYLPASAFRPPNSSVGWQFSGAAVQAQSAGTFVAPYLPESLDLFSGFVVVIDPGGHTGTIRLRCERASGTTELAAAIYGPGTGPTEVYVPVVNPPHQADPSTCGYTVTVDLQPGVSLYGARIDYFSATAGLVLVAPRRIWDSRTPDGSLVVPGIGAGGKISGGQEITFTLQPVVTRFAYGVLLNLTLDQTEGSGYLTVWARGEETPVPPTSNINWYAGNQIVANLVVTRMAGEADVTITAGGPGRTHFIVDLLGYIT